MMRGASFLVGAATFVTVTSSPHEAQNDANAPSAPTHKARRDRALDSESLTAALERSLGGTGLRDS